MMLAALALAIALTWIVPSGSYKRQADGAAIPGSYHSLPKDRSLGAALSQTPAPGLIAAVGPASLFTALPLGMARTSGLIFMILFLGGMFGVLRASGALERAIGRLVSLSGGRVGVVAPLLMLAISAGGSFLGLISEYLIIIPIVLTLSRQLGRSTLFGFAIVAVAAKIGYIGSVTNPVILVVAQPLAGVPEFSGVSLRLAVWVIFLVIGVGFVLRDRPRTGAPGEAPAPANTESGGAGSSELTARHGAIVALLAASVGLVIYGSAHWHWRDVQFASFYVALAAAIALLGGLRPREAAHGFVDGMKAMMLAAFLVGMAGAVEQVLVEGRILDTIVAMLASHAAGLPRVIVAEALVVIEMVLTLLIPSASAKAALSMPILSPIAHLAGLTGQTTVLAFLLGNGLVNMISPTSGMLLAYLATAQLPFSTWFRYVLPLFLILMVLSFAAVAVAVGIGY